MMPDQRTPDRKKPDLRKDPIVGRWVIIAESRAERPHDFQSVPQRPKDLFCPFCEGNESHTPGEIAAYRPAGSAADTPGWSIRVIPNKYPALETDGSVNRRSEGIYDRMAGVGAHEVIIESPEHVVSTSDLSCDQLRSVFGVYRDRLLDLKKDPRLVYGMIFKNVGSAAGASLEHTHSQLIAMPMVPVNVWEEMTGSLEFHHERGECVYCHMIHEELALKQRVVLDTPHFLALAPFAPRFPFETWIVPKAHSSHYEDIGDKQIEGLAHIMRQVIGRIEVALDRPAYNTMIHTAPFDTQELGHYHWHVEIIPRITKMAGFEWGTGFYINPVPPERAAAILRETEAGFPEPQTIRVSETG